MSWLGTAKPEVHPKTYQVKPDGLKRESMFLLGEIRTVRAGRKSAEAVVVR